MSKPEQQSFKDSAKRTIEIEQLAVLSLLDRIDENFELACTLLQNCQGRVVVTGMGKSGHIANKIAATLASTGTPAFFVHPGEASHGDLGMITENDVVLAISNSGKTAEILTIVPLLRRLGISLISMTGDPDSPLSRQAKVNLDISIEKEACPLGLAPTSSTTATLVMGDALAVALLEAKGFTEEDFAFSHPGGSLGRKLLLRVEDIMHTGDRVPVVSAGTMVNEGLSEVSKKGFGLTAVTDTDNKLIGVFTDGDLRRAIDAGTNLLSTKIEDVMTRNGVTTKAEMLAVDALNMMEQRKITGLLVANSEKRVVGVLHMHDLLRAGVI